MSSDCRLFIHPDNAINMNRNGSKTWAIEEETLSPAPSSFKPVLQPNQRNRISGHYGIVRNQLESHLIPGGSRILFGQPRKPFGFLSEQAFSSPESQLKCLR